MRRFFAYGFLLISIIRPETLLANPETRQISEMREIFSLLDVRHFATSRCALDASAVSAIVPYALGKKFMNLNVVADLTPPVSAQTGLGQLVSLNEDELTALCNQGERDVYLNEMERTAKADGKNRIGLQVHSFSSPIFNSRLDVAFVVEGDSYCTWEVRVGQPRRNHNCEAGADLLVFRKRGGKWKQVAKEELWVS